VLISANSDVISADTGRVTVRVMRTVEELTIARPVWRIPGICAEAKESQT